MNTLEKTIERQNKQMARMNRELIKLVNGSKTIYNKDRTTFLQALGSRCPEKGFLPYLKDIVGVPTWLNLTPTSLKRFTEYLKSVGSKRTGKPLQPTTQNLYISHLRLLLKWGNTPINDATQSLKTSKVSPKKKIWLHPDELMRIYNYRPTEEEAPTWKLFMICCLTGCRIIDAPNISPGNIDGLTLRYVPIKTRSTECYINMSSEQINALKSVISIKGNMGDNETLRKIIRNAGIERKFDIATFGKSEIVDISNHIHFHTARYSFATIKKRYSSWDERQIAQAVGHTSFKQTWDNYICDKSPVSEKEKELYKNNLFV